MRGFRIPRLRGVRNYLNNYFSMYKLLTRSRRTHESRIPRLRGVRNYLNKHFGMYKRVTRSRLHVELASAAYFGLGIL